MPTESTLRDALRSLAVLAPPVSGGRVNWVLTGGLACQLHLRSRNAADWCRPTKDIDIFAFSDRLGHLPLSSWEVLVISDGTLRVKPPFGPVLMSGVAVDTCHNYHFNNIVPGPEDVCQVAWDRGTIPALRPELLFVVKTLCPFFRRPQDETDATGLMTAVPFDQDRFANIVARSAFRNLLPARVRPDDLCDTAFRRQLATRLLSEKLDPAQAALFSSLPADRVFPLILVESDGASRLTAPFLRHCVEKHRIEELSEAEQAFALLLACWSEPEPTVQRLVETQELIYESVWLRWNRLRGYFTIASFWGLHMQPLMRSRYAPQLRAGFMQCTLPLSLMVQAGEAAAALRAADAG